MRCGGCASAIGKELILEEVKLMVKRRRKFQTITEESEGRRQLTCFKISRPKGSLIGNWGSAGHRESNRQKVCMYAKECYVLQTEDDYISTWELSRIFISKDWMSKEREGGDIEYDHFIRPHVSKMFMLNTTEWCLWLERMWVTYLFTT